ncbi:MAG TPA: hypothetical protein HA254_07485 [Candidatus Diapherotrites archaeon]|uniref:PGF-pre-PGF domain-containing protein n=1 Tax=Candidatus Iainarchaeum sp. TaxID=3101447 RepID=A0A7J4J1X8_9ARCH|nr:hypothetical protein [Candidatus Diapherotrites archaeon]
MKNIALTLIFLVAIAAAGYAGDITVTRSVPQITALNQEFTVLLQANAEAGDPSGIIISETIPQEWGIISAESACNINEAKRLVKCVLYGENIDKILHYNLKAPAKAPEKAAAISGEWKTLSDSGAITGGMLMITPPQAAPPAAKDTQEAAPQEKPPAQDNTLLMALAAVIILLLAAIALQVSKGKKGEKKK